MILAEEQPCRFLCEKAIMQQPHLCEHIYHIFTKGQVDSMIMLSACLLDGYCFCLCGDVCAFLMPELFQGCGNLCLLSSAMVGNGRKLSR